MKIVNVILTGALTLGVSVSAAFADEIAWPSDFWAKVTNRLDAVEANCSTDSGTTSVALDGTLKSSTTGSWATDFWSWVSSFGLSSERDVSLQPAGFVLVVR